MSPARSTVQIVGDLSAAGAAGCHSGLNVSFYQFQRPHPAVRNVGNGSNCDSLRSRPLVLRLDCRRTARAAARLRDSGPHVRRTMPQLPLFDEIQ